MNKTVLAIAIAILVAGGLWLVLSGGDSAEAPPAEETTSADVAPDDSRDESSEVEREETPSNEAQVETVEVSYTPSGFEPREITVSVGDTVIWTNNSGGLMQVASDDHPEHNDYPGFDQLSPGPSYSFTFDQSGTWGYHNHEDHNQTGRVIVN